MTPERRELEHGVNDALLRGRGRTPAPRIRPAAPPPAAEPSRLDFEVFVRSTIAAGLTGWHWQAYDGGPMGYRLLDSGDARTRRCPLKLLLLPLLLPVALLRHRARTPAGEPLGRRRGRPHHPDGWDPGRGRDLPDDQQGGGPRRPLRDNLTDTTNGRE